MGLDAPREGSRVEEQVDQTQLGRGGEQDPRSFKFL